MVNFKILDQNEKSPEYTGFTSDTVELKEGYVMCSDRTQTYAATTPFIQSRVTKPVAGNLLDFKGVLKSYLPANATPHALTLHEPAGQLVPIFTDQNCTARSGTARGTLLTVQAGSYAAGGLGEGPVFAEAMETVDRSSTNGTVMAVLLGVDAELRKTESANGATRVWSPAIWDSCPIDAIRNGTVDGVFFETDFVDTGAQANNVAAAASTLGGGVEAFTGATAGSTITKETDEPYGVLSLNCTTDNETVCLAGPGSNTAGQIVIAANKRTWIEARIKRTLLTNDLEGLFLGFGEEGLCVTVGVIGADDDMTDKDYVGFHALAADGDTFDTVYNTASGGTSPVTLKADAVTVVADTYVKLGIYSDGTTVTFYKDGTALADTVLVAATDFPNGEEMCFYYALTNKGGEDAAAQIDWIKVANLI